MAGCDIQPVVNGLAVCWRVLSMRENWSASLALCLALS